VRVLQTVLNNKGFNCGTVDAKFGPKTKQAVIAFQRSKDLVADGVVGPKTWAALGSTQPQPTEGVARFNHYPSGLGLGTGLITVRGRSYAFTSGSRSLFSVPTGRYVVTVHLNHRTDAGFVRDGVGFSFILSDANRPNSGTMWDSRANRQRTLLRIHPDGGPRGTAGCIGIVENAPALNRFRDDMNAEIRQNGGLYRLLVQ
jgi:hypothetical protein